MFTSRFSSSQSIAVSVPASIDIFARCLSADVISCFCGIISVKRLLSVILSSS